VPKTTYPKDRFDDLPADLARIGVHRAENPRLRAGVVLMWCALATIALIVIGIFGTMLATGRFAPGAEVPAPVADAAPVEAVVDTGYPVLVLNATGEEGLASTVSDTIVAAGWSADDVIAGEAGSDDFPATTVYYPTPDDEGAARGLAEVVGGTEVALSDSYQPTDDPDTADVDESAVRQLVVVLGLDSIEATP
jgi:hypothetical protein